MMKNVTLAALTVALLTLSGQSSAGIAGNCVATADLPKSILGANDTIRITHQLADPFGPTEVDPQIRVMSPAGDELGSFELDLAVNASVTFKISEIYQKAGLRPLIDGLSPNVVQIVAFRDFQAVYKNGLGFVTPLLFTCGAFG
jgi:hypothetical protein